jgi:hypothetical protein
MAPVQVLVPCRLQHPAAAGKALGRKVNNR